MASPSYLALRRTGKPAAEPITLPEAKVHLRVDGTADDALILLYLQAARESVENTTGRCMLPQDWAMDLAGWPADGVITIPHAPLISVASIETTDAAGETTTLDEASYVVVAPAGPTADLGSIRCASGFSWPSVDTAVPSPITITYRAGYVSFSEVPASLRNAMLLTLGGLFANREDSSVAKINDHTAAGRLMAAHRILFV